MEEGDTKSTFGVIHPLSRGYRWVGCVGACCGAGQPRSTGQQRHAARHAPGAPD